MVSWLEGYSHGRGSASLRATSSANSDDFGVCAQACRMLWAVIFAYRRIIRTKTPDIAPVVELING